LDGRRLVLGLGRHQHDAVRARQEKDPKGHLHGRRGLLAAPVEKLPKEGEDTREDDDEEGVDRLGLLGRHLPVADTAAAGGGGVGCLRRELHVRHLDHRGRAAEHVQVRMLVGPQVHDVGRLLEADPEQDGEDADNNQHDAAVEIDARRAGCARGPLFCRGASRQAQAAALAELRTGRVLLGAIGVRAGDVSSVGLAGGPSGLCRRLFRQDHLLPADDPAHAGDVNDEPQHHPHTRGREPVVVAVGEAQPATDQRADERAEVDAHVEDRERTVTPFIVRAIQCTDLCRNVRLEESGTDDQTHQAGIEERHRLEGQQEVSRCDDHTADDNGPAGPRDLVGHDSTQHWRGINKAGIEGHHVRGLVLAPE